MEITKVEGIDMTTTATVKSILTDNKFLGPFEVRRITKSLNLIDRVKGMNGMEKVYQEIAKIAKKKEYDLIKFLGSHSYHQWNEYSIAVQFYKYSTEMFWEEEGILFTGNNLDELVSEGKIIGPIIKKEEPKIIPASLYPTSKKRYQEAIQIAKDNNYDIIQIIKANMFSIQNLFVADFNFYKWNKHPETAYRGFLGNKL